jgi:hypothetical protein
MISEERKKERKKENVGSALPELITVIGLRVPTLDKVQITIQI